MFLTVILGLSICSLLGFSTLATVIFTVVFSVCSFSVFIWCKLRLGIDEAEVKAIRSYITRARRIKKKVHLFLAQTKSKAAKLRPILERM